jgi:hypothetical protein
MNEPGPVDASAALDEARRSQARLAAGVRLPRWFLGSIGVAIAAQILTASVGVVVDSAPTYALLAAGVLAFVAVAWIQVARFRRRNGIRVDGLISRVVLGTATTASLAYTAGLGGAIWAGFTGYWWLSALCAAAGGAGYAASGMRWMRLYRGDPQAHARAESVWWVLTLAALAVAGLFLLIVES